MWLSVRCSCACVVFLWVGCDSKQAKQQQANHSNILKYPISLGLCLLLLLLLLDTHSYWY